MILYVQETNVEENMESFINLELGMTSDPLKDSFDDSSTKQLKVMITILSKYNILKLSK